MCLTNMRTPLLLIYEHDPSQQKLYSLIAPRLGWDCVIVGSCKELAQAVKYAFFDALIISLDKDEMKNFECITKVKEITAKQKYFLPVLAATSFAMPDEVERTRKAGVHDHMTKPFSIEEFKRRVIRVIQYCKNPFLASKISQH